MILRAATASTTSLYAVIDIDSARKRVHARDLLHDGGDLWITDVSLSSTITRRMVLIGRVFEVVKSVSYLGGGLF